MLKRSILWLVMLTVTLWGLQSSLAKEISLKLKGDDGFEMDAKLALPDGATESSLTKAVVLIHGSGPQDMDLDVTIVTKGKKKNQVFKELSDALVKKGFAVLRYNKRTYELGRKLRKDKSYAKTPEFRGMLKKLLYLLVEDAKSAAGLLKKRLPKSKITFLGVSQGTYVALQAARQFKDTAGVVLIGFYATPLATIMFEQIVYRPMILFRQKDKNHDGKLSKAEMTGKFAPLVPQLVALDMDKDGHLNWQELMAGNFMNALIPGTGKHYFVQELNYPPVALVLRKSTWPVLFFQGMWDNQTPVYHSYAIKIAATYKWKKSNLKFWFFPKRGHILDPRDSYMDVVYRKMDPAIRAKLVDQMNSHFK